MFYFCCRICASSFAVWAAKLLAFRIFYFSPSCAFAAFMLCFSELLFLDFLDSRGRERERVRVKKNTGGDRRRGGEGEVREAERRQER